MNCAPSLSWCLVDLALMSDFPVVLEFPGGEVDAWLAGTAGNIEKALDDAGAVLLRGLPVASAREFDDVVAVFDLPVFSYEESLSNAVRINHTSRVFTANEAPPDVEIHLHHEMAQTPISPSRLFFCCISPAEAGGATPLCQSELLLAAFSEQHPAWTRALREKGLRYVTRMPSENDESAGQGRSWKSTLDVASRGAAEARLTELGYDFMWQPDDSLRTVSPVLPGVIKVGEDRESFFHQLLAAYLGWPGVREDPASALSFGDGSTIPVEMLEALAALSGEFTHDLQWQAGDVAIVNNRLIMHGRRAYAGSRKREVLVSMAP